MGPLIGSALIGAGSSLLGGLLGRKNNESTNKTNMAIHQMNNEFNAAEAQKARDFQLEMWNRQNEYNSPSAQRQRLAAAGYNPFMAQTDAGSASSAGSTSAASAAPPIQAQPYDWSNVTSSMAQNAVSGFRAFVDNKLADAQVENLQGQKQLAEAQAMQTLANVDWGRLSKETQDYLRRTGLKRAQIGMSREQQELNNMEYEGLLKRAEAASHYQNAESQRIMNKYLDDQQKSDLMLKAASAFSASSAGQASLSSARKMLAEEIESYARTNGQRISNKVAAQTADNLIQALNFEHEASASYYRGFSGGAYNAGLNETWSRYYDTKTKQRHYRSMPFETGSRVIGNAIGVVRAFKGK